MMHQRHLASIHLHGPLGERYGETHRLAVSSPIEAIAALDANYPGFIAEFAKHESYGLFADGDWRSGDEAASMPFSRELHFCPIIEGRAFLGAMLVGAIFPSIAGTMTATIIGGLLMAGVMFGLSYLLMPKVKKPDDKKDENYAFSGPENVTGQGVAVPLIYGRVYAGSVVISAGLDLGTDLAATVAAPAALDITASTYVPPGTPAPPGGWPALFVDSLGRTGPTGWNVISSTYVVSALDGVIAGTSLFGKKVDLWQHPTSTRYYYNRVRGFYYSPLAKVQPKDTDYQRHGGALG